MKSRIKYYPPKRMLTSQTFGIKYNLGSQKIRVKTAHRYYFCYDQFLQLATKSDFSAC